MKAPKDSIRIGISACILGQEVRFNGGHKLDSFIRDRLGSYVEFVPVCPEVDIGLGVPRDALRLVRRRGSHPLLIAPNSGEEQTTAMISYARRKVAELEKLNLCGYILQKGSPSCGMARVKIYPREDGGRPSRDGRGLFAAVLMEKLPLMPAEEDGRLNDPQIREHFIERVFAYHRLRELFSWRWTIGDLVAFHAREELLLMAHDRHQTPGIVVAKAKQVSREDLEREYREVFLAAMARCSSVDKHAHVLHHIAGYFRKHLDRASRDEMFGLIEAYRLRQVPLIAPIILVRHHVRHLGLDYLADQSYLNPHPRDLMLRNHV